MSQEHLALSTIPPPAADGDYDAICATVMSSARGRWFLDEYARRNRTADTALVLAAVQRLEVLIRATNEREAHRSLRLDLLEMARTIAATRAEVAETNPAANGKDDPADPEAELANSGVHAMAERIQDVAWTMRERGLDPATCEQIEALAGAILSASVLRDPNDHRTRKLGEVLRYLEHRITRMLDATPTLCVENGPREDLKREDLKREDAKDADGRTAEAPHAFDEPAASAAHEAASGADAPEPAPEPALGPTPAPTTRLKDLELEPLVVIPFPVRGTVAEAAQVEFELDPIAVKLPPAVTAIPAAPAAAAPPAHADMVPAAVGEQTTAARRPPAQQAAVPVGAPARDGLLAVPSMPRAAPRDLLAALKAMSNDERIALFS